MLDKEPVHAGSQIRYGVHRTKFPRVVPIGNAVVVQMRIQECFVVGAVVQEVLWPSKIRSSGSCLVPSLYRGSNEQDKERGL